MSQRPPQPQSEESTSDTDADGRDEPARGCPVGHGDPESSARTKGCPVGAESDESDQGDGEVTYGSYLKVPELLDLQHPRSSSGNRDEIFFIIIHQAYELWFRQIIVELEGVIEQMQSGTLQEARRLLERVLEIEELLVKQIHLLETLTPRDFGRFRNAIRPASGFESAQFREVEFLTGLKDAGLVRVYDRESEEHARLTRRLEGPDLRTALYARMRAEGFGIPEEIEDSNWKETVRAFVPLYTDYEAHWELYRLCEALLSHDQWLLTWRFHHVRVVERIIGLKTGTGGSPGVRYLERTLKKRAFPALVEARTLLDDDELFAGYARSD